MVYEAATDPDPWPDFLIGLSSPVQESYNQHYSKLNVWPEKGGLFYVAGKVNLDDELCEKRRTGSCGVLQRL